MSSLGDLLLGKVRDRSVSPANDNNKPERETVRHEDARAPQENDNCDENSRRLSQQANDDSYHTDSQKIFPNRIEKNEVKQEDDCRSNTSSTDDYVRELLDPNDRPRNVWHVVEGPKKSSSDDDNDMSNDSGAQAKSDKDEASNGRDEDENHRYRGTDNNEYRRDTEDGSKHEEEAQKASNGDEDISMHVERVASVDEDRVEDRDRERGRDRDRDRNRERNHDSDRDRGRDREKDRNRHRHRDRDHEHEKRRSHRSSRRRHDYSDDDDRDRDVEYRRRHGSRHRSSRRSRSRSLSRRRSRSGSQSPATKRNSRTVLVMQLSPRATTRDLEDFFSDLGDVREVRLIMDNKTRRHKGIAYIEFENASTATKALALDGKRFLGATMQIQSALVDRNRGDHHHQTSSSTSHHHHQQQQQHHHHHQPLLPHHHHSSSSSSINPSSSHPLTRTNLPPNSYRIYIGGLHVGITEDMLRTIVEPFGSILRLELIKDRSTGISRGYAFVLFASIEDGQEAVKNLDGFELAGKNLRVSKSTEKTDH